MVAVRPIRHWLPERVWSHLWFVGVFEAKVHGAKFRMMHRGHQVENELFWRDTFEHERGTIKVAADLLRSTDVFFDIGANTGVFSLLAKGINPAIKVVSAEPSRANLELLMANVGLNAFDIKVEDAAVTSVDGQAVLHDMPGVSYSASLEGDWREGTVERTVRATTLDSIAARHGCAGRLLIKIDVEGHEAEVLKGAPCVIASKPTFLIEIIRKYVADGVIEHLPPSDFDYFLIDERTGGLSNRTNRAASLSDADWGNYLIKPRTAAGGAA